MSFFLMLFSYAERVETLLQLRQHGTTPFTAGPVYSKNVCGIQHILLMLMSNANRVSKF